MKAWCPISKSELDLLIIRQLGDCSQELVQIYAKYRVEPFKAPITRYGAEEQVYVVAKNSSEVMYYEDVEEGFNFSPLSNNGHISEHWCNQDELRYALQRWRG